jgi:hypothetical protein
MLSIANCQIVRVSAVKVGSRVCFRHLTTGLVVFVSYTIPQAALVYTVLSHVPAYVHKTLKCFCAKCTEVVCGGGWARACMRACLCL